MQGCITSNVKKLFFLFSVVLILISCGGGNTDSLPAKPTIEPTGTVNGIGFDGLLINADVSVYNWSTGTVGDLLGTTKTDNSGHFTLDIISPSIEILVILENGFYIEEASGKKIQLDSSLGNKLSAVTYYTSGQTITINATFFSTLAHGLSEYYIKSNTFSVSNAITQANRVMVNWVGFDTAVTKPLDVTDIGNVTTSLKMSNGHKYGYVSAAISKLTLKIHTDANIGAHTVWPSIAFIQRAYEDIQDGVLDGKNDITQLSLGLMNFTTNTYRDILATHLLQFVLQSNNKVGLTFDDLKPFASIINNVSSSIFSNSAAPDITAKKASIINVIPTDGINISTNYKVSASVTDDFGIVKVEFFIDGQLVATANDNANPQYTIDITSVSAGAHSLKIMATNLMGNTTEEPRAFNVVLDASTIAGLVPTDGSTITNTYTAKATVTDTYGLKKVDMFLDGVLLPAPTDMANPSYLIDILKITEGAHKFKVVATNVLGKITSIENNFNVVFSTPSIIKLLPSADTTLTGNTNFSVTVSDIYGDVSVVYLIDDVQVFGQVGKAPDYIQTVNTQLLPNGKHTLSVRVTNRVGKTTSSTPIAIVIANGFPSVAQLTLKTELLSGGVKGGGICNNLPIEITDSNKLGIASVAVSWFVDYGAANAEFNGTYSTALTATSNVGDVYLYHLTLNPTPHDLNNNGSSTGNGSPVIWTAPLPKNGDNRYGYGYFKIIVTDNARKTTTFTGYNFGAVTRLSASSRIYYCGYF